MTSSMAFKYEKFGVAFSGFAFLVFDFKAFPVEYQDPTETQEEDCEFLSLCF